MTLTADLIVISALVAALVALASALGISLARTRRRFRLLGRIARVSDEASSLPETLDAICEILVPEFADFCMIDIVSEGRARRAATRAAPEQYAELAQRLAERKPSLPDRMVEDSGESLRPRFYERMTEADLREIAHDDGEDFEFLESLGVRSAVTVALRARGQVTGALTMSVAWSGRRYRRDDAEFAWILSGRVALALDNAGLSSDLERAESARAEIAETLQRGLLPPPLPHIPGWSAAAVYRPAGAENEIGGDFYDAFPIPEGWMLVIGDVTGRGAQAASVTAQARYTLRAAALLTGDPLVALATLNRALLARRDSALCSVAAIAVSEDPEEPVSLAVAGHPPPLHVDGTEVAESTAAGPVLGAFADAQWTIERRVLRPGQQVVIVTDGITEACGPAGRFGEERLRDELAGTPSPVLAVQRLEGALHSFTEGRLDDDAAILALAPTARRQATDLTGVSSEPVLALGGENG